MRAWIIHNIAEGLLNALIAVVLYTFILLWQHLVPPDNSLLDSAAAAGWGNPTPTVVAITTAP